MELACFFFNDTATTEIYTLSLHDALPISVDFPEIDQLTVNPLFADAYGVLAADAHLSLRPAGERGVLDRKSTRLNSSHANISYAVFCLKKKKLTKMKVTWKIRKEVVSGAG